MKQVIILFSLLLVSTMSYTKIGRHNLQINVGGGYQAVFKPETFSLFTKDPGYVLGGGMVTVELGYLFHSVRENNIVHGFDLRADFSMGFLNATVLEDSAVKVTQKSTKMYGGFAMTYTLGRQLKSGRLMFDIIGYGIRYGSTDSSRTATINERPLVTSSFGIYNGLSFQYIGPGIQFMMNNGFTIGWRNKAKIYLGAQIHEGMFGFDTSVTLGFTFGSGKQPWEN